MFRKSGSLNLSSILFFVAIILVSVETNAQSPEFSWVQWGGGTGRDMGWSMSTNADGYTVVVGEYEDNASFSGTELQSNGITDIFIAKYDKNGNLVWINQAGGGGKDAPSGGVIMDNSGNVFISGYFTGSANFGQFYLNSYGDDDTDMFVAKYNSSGDIQWAKSAGGTADDKSTGISLDVSGDLIINGNFSETAYFGSYSISANNTDDLLLAKYSKWGNVTWVKRVGGNQVAYGNNELSGVRAYGSGNIIMTGYFTGSLSLGSQVLNSVGGKDLFIAKFDESGNFNWAKRAGGVEDDVVYDKITDDNDNIYITGYFQTQRILARIN